MTCISLPVIGGSSSDDMLWQSGHPRGKFPPPREKKHFMAAICINYNHCIIIFMQDNFCCPSTPYEVFFLMNWKQAKIKLQNVSCMCLENDTTFVIFITCGTFIVSCAKCTEWLL
jgi:hypothetical protein